MVYLAMQMHVATNKIQSMARRTLFSGCLEGWVWCAFYQEKACSKAIKTRGSIFMVAHNNWRDVGCKTG